MTFCGGKSPSRGGKSPRLAINKSQSIALGKRPADDLDAPPSKKPRQNNAEFLIKAAFIGSISTFVHSLGTQLTTSSGKIKRPENTKKELTLLAEYLDLAIVQIKEFNDMLWVPTEEEEIEVNSN
jgi:hypothetical protein